MNINRKSRNKMTNIVNNKRHKSSSGNIKLRQESRQPHNTQQTNLTLGCEQRWIKWFDSEIISGYVIPAQCCPSLLSTAYAFSVLSMPAQRCLCLLCVPYSCSWSLSLHSAQDSCSMLHISARCFIFLLLLPIPAQWSICQVPISIPVSCSLRSNAFMSSNM